MDKIEKKMTNLYVKWKYGINMLPFIIQSKIEFQIHIVSFRHHAKK